MKMPLNQVKEVINEYFDTVLMPAARTSGDSLTLFTTGFVKAIVASKTDEMIQRYLPMAQHTGLVSEGFIDVDALYDYARQAMNSSGSVQVLSYKADMSDIDKIKELMIKRC